MPIAWYLCWTSVIISFCPWHDFSFFLLKFDITKDTRNAFASYKFRTGSQFRESDAVSRIQFSLAARMFHPPVDRTTDLPQGASIGAPRQLVTLASMPIRAKLALAEPRCCYLLMEKFWKLLQEDAVGTITKRESS